MTRLLATAALCLATATAAAACPWAGGNFEFREHGIYGDFAVNAGCTELVWDRLSNAPETTALTRSKHGWAGKLAKADVELLDNGENLRVTGTGGAMRQVRAKRAD
ncbi:hypothetical protein KQ247_01395 [Ruegeria pomeroyi]|uniref:Lipoprotein, putative n=2 Tax=Ruegeria pomeroyi TaxID=89184 RepID=Q5LQL2_RUEPO|nr:hypothetical protein [Ruegeria pomeroyi]HCE71020.1 hypothetical protein [Ruegeria sp.]AAV95730.1 lipoprotein, putative [Ruegeria pomeroyi DSS-3]NVK98948.1 hypothetical protein [Ruegeria pomeroyi]NVL03672.1 hypothetical protein [Ruegeria pomeroyi]QWV09312.1 hypothetical protein KQ247_01395 [Ruegeria pomeroyi]